MPASVEVSSVYGFGDLFTVGTNNVAKISEGRPSGPWAVGTATGTLFAIVIDRAAAVLRMYKSTNTGTTWAEADSANHPAIFAVNTATNNGTWAFQQQDSVMATNTVYTAYTGTDTKIRVIEFDMANSTWATLHTGGPTLFSPGAAADNNNEQFPVTCIGRQSAGDLIIAYSGTNETVSSVGRARTVVNRLTAGTAGTWTAIATFSASTTNNYLLHSLLVSQSDRVHVFMDKQHGQAALNFDFMQACLTTAGTFAAEQVLASSTLGSDFLIYPGMWRSSDNYIMVPYINQDDSDLSVAEATDADSPTWTLTDLTALSTTYIFPRAFADTRLVMAAPDGNSAPWIFFADNNEVGIAEFNKASGTWHVNDPLVYTYNALDGELAFSIGAGIIGTATNFGVLFGDESGSFGKDTRFLFVAGGTATSGGQFIWGPLNITY